LFPGEILKLPYSLQQLFNVDGKVINVRQELFPITLRDSGISMV
jgi:hypothetical protein